MMTDRVKGLRVAFKEDIRIDDVQKIKEAILLIKGVVGVGESITGSDDWINRTQIRHEYIQKIVDVFKQGDER